MAAVSLVERDRELEMLAAVVERAAAGEGGLALVEGPAGIGKSRLLAEVRERAAGAGSLTLAARCSEHERAFAFGVVLQLFEACVADPGQRDEVLAGAAAGAGSVFASAQAAPDPAQPTDASFATLHGLYWLVLNLAATAPLVLVVDDLHWCDRASLRFIAYLARRLEDQPILVATTLRSADPGSDPALIAEIARDPLTVTIQPSPLSEAATAEIVRERLARDAPQALCVACHNATGGNPLLVGQLLSALGRSGGPGASADPDSVREIGPRAVARTVLLRLAPLPATAIGVARAVAVFGDGDGGDLAAVASLTGLDERHVAEVSAELARAEILRFDAPLRFVHPLVRDAVYRGWPQHERDEAHDVVAQMLDDAGAGAERVAAHMLLMPCRGRARTATRLHEAARLAAIRGAPDAAVTYLLRALDEPPPPELRPRILLELGLSEAMTNGPAAVEHLRAAYEELPDDQLRAVAAHMLAQALIFTGEAAQAAEFARQAAANVPDELADQRLVLEAIELATLYFGVDDPELVRRLQAHRLRGVGDGPGAKMLAAVTAFEWTLTGGGHRECTALALAALEGDELLAADAGFFSVEAIAVLSMADRDEAIEQWDRALAVAHRRGSLFAVLGVELWKGHALLCRGELAEAEDLLHSAAGGLRLWGAHPVAESYQQGFLAAVLMARGDLSGARAAIGELPPGGGFDHLRLRCEVELLLAEGAAQRALERAREYRVLVGRIVNPGWAPWRSLQALALSRLGHAVEALELMEEELEHARRWGAAGTVGRTLRLLSTLVAGSGTEQLEEAVAVLENSTARLELARALAALGAALRRSRRPSDARDPLRRALELADHCGAAGLAADVRTELHATGARPRTSALSGSASLTASESRVAALAAEGHTNRDIAQALYVTPKTVELHLSNGYRKLGIRSRRELALALALAEP